MIRKKYLYYIAAFIWGIPGIMIAIKGVRAYMKMPKDELWWLSIITIVVLISFICMFARIVKKYAALIAAQEQNTSIWHTFPLKGWILVVCMSCLGMVLKFIPFITLEFTASFYSGLGPALMIAAILFCINSKRY